MTQQLDRDDLVRLAIAGETEASYDIAPVERYHEACRSVAARIGRDLTDDERLTLHELYTPGSMLVEHGGGAAFAPGKSRDKLDREVLLEKACAAVVRGREETYGAPESSFGLIADFWSAYLEVAVKPADVAAMMGLLKIARLRNDPAHEDSWTDLAGYAANGYEVSRGAARNRADG